MTHVIAPVPDAVSDALRSLTVRSTIFCLSELRAPWAFRVGDDGIAKFHVVLEGRATLVGPTGEPMALAEGDVVVLPRGPTHTLAHDPGARAVELEQLLAETGLEDGWRLRAGGDGLTTRLLCGGFAVAEAMPASTLSVLPDVVRIRREEAASTGSHDMLLEALTLEAESRFPGASAIVAKLADVFLAQTLRAWMVDAGNGVAGAGLVHDNATSRAVHALNTRPAEAWSLERLARHVGLSRTALAVKFRAATGRSPMRYLSTVRLHRAAAYLAAGGLTTQEIARLTGYRNDASLSKAFKREYGLAPGAYRDAARGLPAVDVTES